MIYRTFQNSPAIRLAKYKESEAKILARHPDAHPNFIAAHSWRSSRYPKPNVLTRKGPKTPNYYYQPEDKREPRTMPLDSLNDWPGTEEGTASDILKLKHNGWYTDNFQDETVYGVVLSLRTPHGRRYYPAISSKSFDVTTVYIGDWFEGDDAECEAARRADQYAESYAEDAREHDAQFQAEQQIEEARKEIKTTRRQILDLCKEIKQAGKQFSPAICSALTGRVQELLHERQEAFEKIDELKSNFWAAVEH
jgi:hypothetical protein